MALPKAPQRTTPAFGFSLVDRAIREGFASRAFGQSEMAKIVRFFFNDKEPDCVYCGSRDVGRWDHVVPVAKGGDTVVGNMVLACATCDDSKQAFNFETWMKGPAPKSPGNRGVKDISQRVRRIRQYAKKYEYEARDFAQRLDKAEQDELHEIQNQMSDVRRRLEGLISDYQRRVELV